MYSTVSLKSDKSGREHQYLVINQLPSSFRSYNTKEVYVRGLLWSEAIHLSKFVGDMSNPSYSQLVQIYKDVIQGVDILDLEIPDFIILLTISSIYTMKDFGWIPNIQCVHLVENPKIKEKLKEIDELRQLTGSTNENNEEIDINAINEKISSLQEEIELLPKVVRCEGVITEKITLDDLEIEESKITKLPIPIQMGGKDILIGAYTVRDQIEKEKAQVSDEDKMFLPYALLIKNKDMTLEEKLNLVKFAEASEIMQIQKIDEELFIGVKPIKKRCPVCGQINNIEVSLNQLKAYP